MNAVKELQKQVGNKFMYLAKQVTIKRVTQENPESDIVIETSYKDVRVNPKNAMRFFNDYFLPLDTPNKVTIASSYEPTKKPTPHISEIEPSYTPKMIMGDRSIVQTLKDTLLDSIEKIKRDDSYLPQATAINQTAKTLIDLAKSELEFHKFNSK